MFNELVESVAAKKTTNKGWGMLVSAIFQCACLITLVAIPLLRTQALPRPMVESLLIAPAAPASARPSQAVVSTEANQHSVRLLNYNQINAPRFIPLHASIFVEPDLPPETALGIAESVGGGLDLLHSLAEDSTAATPVTPPVRAPQRIREGGIIEAAKIIAQPQPTYPVLAVQASIQGNVVLHAIIGKDGRVSELEIISGDPRLVKAALDAVRQWRYQPTLLNGEPVEVDTTITVSFVLGG